MRSVARSITFRQAINRPHSFRRRIRATVASQTIALMVSFLANGVQAQDAQLAATRDVLTWQQLPSIPDPVGRAGMFAGVSDGSLLVAGGANFPKRPPWEGGVKEYHDTVYRLAPQGTEWEAVGRLPRAAAYGTSITIAQGIVCIGGNDAEQAFRDVFVLSCSHDEVTTTPLPALPRGTTAACGAKLGRYLYLAGGTSTVDPLEADSLHTFLRLDLESAAAEWEAVEAWPGLGRFHAVAGVQNNALFLFSGIRLAQPTGSDATLEYLSDAYSYQPASASSAGGWKRVADLPRPNAAAPSPALSLGPWHLMLVGGGADGRHVELPLRDRPGVLDECLAYNALSDTWVGMGSTPAPRVTTPAVMWGDRYVVPSGEVRPGVRSDEVWAARSSTKRASFGWVNYLALAGYLAAMVGIGVYFSRRNKSTDDFFRGGQHLPWWAVGLSIFATLLSSITFVAVPAAAYVGGWTLFLSNSYLILTPIVIAFYLPHFRRLNITSAYEYLEQRFNLATRLIGSALFMLLQGGRIAIVLYLPALAMATVSNIDINACIITMGVLCVAYTMMGGIETVVWTDVAQAIILIAGALGSLLIIVLRVDGGLAGIYEIAEANNKFFGSVDWSFDPRLTTGWVLLVGSIFTQLLPYTASQDVVQRFVTTKDERSAARSIWMNALVSLPASILFFAIGTALFAFYKQHPAALDPDIPNDAIYPLFIVRELPLGIAGMVVAAIFAAAQSTLSSSLNSISAAYITDFHRRLRPRVSEQECLRLARWIILVVGLAGTGVSLVLAASRIESLYITFIEVLGLFGGTLSGLFALGIFFRRANGAGALCGAVASVCAVVAVRCICPVSPFAYAPIGVLTCVACGYVGSLLVARRVG